MRSRIKMYATLGMISLALGSVLAGTASAVSTGTAEVDLLVTYNGVISVNVDGAAYDTYTLVAYDAGSGNSTQSPSNPGANAYAAPTSSITVTNNGGITERWELDVSTISGGNQWVLNDATGSAHVNNAGGAQEACSGSCPGAEQYEMQAMFVSSSVVTGNYGTDNNHCPAVSSTTWDTVVDTVPAHPGFTTAAGTSQGFALYRASQYADPEGINGPTGLPDFSVQAGLANDGDMLPINTPGYTVGVGQRGLCVRMTMPATTVTTTQQTIQLEITAIVD